MYREVTCWNTGNTYRVTDTGNIPTGYGVFTRDDDGYYSPVEYRDEFVIVCEKPKPSVYKKDWYRCKPDKYDYQYTETELKTTVKDVYYNAKRGRFLTKTRTSERKLIVW